MGEQWSSDTGTSKGEVSSIVAELTRRLEALEACLGEATRSAAEMKTLLDRVGALEAVLGDLETTMVRVRQQIRSSGTSQGETVPSPALQAVQRAEPVQGQVSQPEAKLAGERFEEEAPPHNVAQEEEQLAASRSRLEELRKRLAELGQE
jgi:valyl-tRNA synthetase